MLFLHIFRLFCVFQDVLHILDLNESVIQNEEFVRCVSGGKLFPGSVPLAHRYGGHQVKLTNISH